MSDPLDPLEQARRDLDLSIDDLWTRYFALGGMSTLIEVEAVLFGALVGCAAQPPRRAPTISRRHGDQARPAQARDPEGRTVLCAEIPCAAGDAVWTAGEQLFFRDKELKNPPKHCKSCKKAKNIRLEAIELARTTGQRHRIEVSANCARCETTTTVPVYPCQGRPVYCRACYIALSNGSATGTNGRSS